VGGKKFGNVFFLRREGLNKKFFLILFF